MFMQIVKYGLLCFLPSTVTASVGVLPFTSPSMITETVWKAVLTRLIGYNMNRTFLSTYVFNCFISKSTFFSFLKKS